jgi:hypothetical protein
VEQKRYPFKAEPNPQNQNALGTIVLGTSVVLLPAGNLYYRVRGFNYGLPTGAQQMSGPTPPDRRRETQFSVIGGANSPLPNRA